MKICVFLGPSLSHEQAKRHLDASYLSPARRGDVLRALAQEPAAIGIVDGAIEPAVEHKEILLALEAGVRVFGAAAEGAILAAELGSFGMIGVGSIFESYASGQLEDDGEVRSTGGASLRAAEAVQLLERMAEPFSGPKPSFRTERTTLLEDLINEARLGDLLHAEPIAGELVDLPRRKALLRILARREIERLGIDITDEDVVRAEREFRALAKLEDDAELAAWLRYTGVSPESFVRIMRDHAALRKLDTAYQGEVNRILPDHTGFVYPDVWRARRAKESM